jgi:NitT/TauT family transport system substrate-binding protein
MCIAVFSCKKSNENANEVRIAYFPNITHAQALVMKGQGILEKKGIAVKWRAFNAGPSEIEALFAGEIDIGYIGPVPAANGYVQSQGDLKIVAGASNGGSVLVVRKAAGINSVAELNGKTVAVPQFGNTQHLSLLGLLNANNLKPTSKGGTVNVVQSSNPDIANLMDQSRIDAALVPEPWGSILELKYNAGVLLDYNEVDANGIPSTAVVIVSKDFLGKRRNIVEKFMEAHKEATLYINENPAAKEIINAQISEVTQSVIENDILESAFKRLDITYQIPSESIMNFAKISLDEKFVSKLPDMDMIDSSLK